ncbi:MAG TPA: DUF1365 domain-containing protein [Kofleriaceae bacterium]
MTDSALYRGELVHARNDAIAQRSFRYGVYVAALDLDELPALDRELRLFSYRKRNLFSFDDRDYAASLSPSRRALSPSNFAARELREELASLRAANGIETPAATRLVTNLRVLGYTFNPVSFFLGYDATGALTSVIAEVNNTYGGRFRYVLGPAERIDQPAGTARIGFRHVRELFVSPFLHGPATYELWFDARLDSPQLAITMHVEQHGKRVFTSRLTGERAPLSDRALVAAALRYPMMTAQVIGLIHYQALKLRLAGVPYRRPNHDQRPLATE